MLRLLLMRHYALLRLILLILAITMLPLMLLPMLRRYYHWHCRLVYAGCDIFRAAGRHITDAISLRWQVYVYCLAAIVTPEYLIRHMLPNIDTTLHRQAAITPLIKIKITYCLILAAGWRLPCHSHILRQLLLLPLRCSMMLLSLHIGYGCAFR